MTAKPNMKEQQIVGAMNIQGRQGGLSAMISEAGGSKSMVKEVQKVEAMPGGMELLYTMAAEDLMKKAGASKGDTKKVRLFKYGGAVEQAAASSSYTTVLNGRFKGGYITRHYGDPTESIHAIQLELSQRCYMDEGTREYQDSNASKTVAILRQMLSVFIEAGAAMNSR